MNLIRRVLTNLQTIDASPKYIKTSSASWLVWFEHKHKQRQQYRLNEDLYDACKNIHLSSIRNLIKQGGDPLYQTPRSGEYPPYIWAIFFRRYDVLKVIANQKPEHIDKYIECAIREDNVDALKCLESEGADLENSNQLYKRAVDYGSLKAMKYLVSKGASVSPHDLEVISQRYFENDRLELTRFVLAELQKKRSFAA